MKICYLANGELPQTQLRINYLSKENDVFLISSHGFGNGFDEDVKRYLVDFDFSDLDLYKIPFKFFEMKKTLHNIKKILRKIDPDIIHAFYITHYGLIGALSGFRPLVISTMGSDLATTPDNSLIYKCATKFTLNEADMIHIQDPLSKMKIRRMGINNEKLFSNPWGVDTESLSPTDVGKKYDIISLRTFKKHYHVKTLIKAIKIVKKQYQEVKVILLGGGKREPILKRFAKTLGVYENIKFKGFVSLEKVPKLLSQSKIFVDTFYSPNNSIGHTYGVGLHQAMACGVPTVVANRPTIEKLKGENKWYHGLTFKGSDRKDLAKNLKKLLDNKDLQKKIAEKNRKEVEKKFDISRNVKIISEKYKELI